MPDALSPFLNAIENADSAASLSDAVQALADACLVESISHLIEALSYNNPGAAVAAVDGLINLGEPAVPALLEQLDLNNYTARSWAIRALAGIGDPRGLMTLLGAATADISMSVRRAAARGLGQMKWHLFPFNLLEIAQSEAFDALLFVAQQDEEWVVRYAAVVGLESLALAPQSRKNTRRQQIEKHLDQISQHEESITVRARIQKAQQYLQEAVPLVEASLTLEPSSLSSTDWEQILERLYNRKLRERTVSEGDPKHFKQLLDVAQIQRS